MREGWRNKGSHSAVLSADEGGGQRCITPMVRNQNKKVTLACSQCCMQNTQTQSRLGPFDARGPQRNKTRSVFHLLCTAFISLTRSSTSGITRTQTACKSVPLLLGAVHGQCKQHSPCSASTLSTSCPNSSQKLTSCRSFSAPVTCICGGSRSSGSCRFPAALT